MPVDCNPAAIEAALKEDGRYQQIKLIGKGSFGCVCQARNLQTGETIAIKLLPRSEVNKYVETEIVNHSLMRHPHIIQFRDVFVTSSYIAIVLEYAATGTLHAYVRTCGHLRESVARWFFQQLAVAVDYCHKKGVANRDIKLENTLLHSVPHLPLPLLKICDFGYSKEENKSAAKSKVGTLTYMAPEVLLNITGQTRYEGKIADIWSCGVMLYVMLTGRYPFDSPNTKGVIQSPQDFIVMLEQMVACKYELPAHLDLSDDCKDLLQRMLLPEPHKRITTDEILAHPWFHTNLPPEAATMNERCLLLEPMEGVPSPEKIQQLVRAACGNYSSGSGGGCVTSSASKGSGNSSETKQQTSSVTQGSPMVVGVSQQQQQQQQPPQLPHQQQQQQHQQQQLLLLWPQQQQHVATGQYLPQQQQHVLHQQHQQYQQHQHYHR